MRKYAIAMLAITAFTISYPMLRAQDIPPNFRQEFLRQFNYSADRLLSLAQATPGEKFSWRPSEDVMSIEHVYMHIARYNYYYPENSLGIKAPEEIDVENLEKVTGKSQVIDLLQRSLDHVRQKVKQMPEDRLSESTILYGRQTAGWSVLLQLVAHMNEHVGQSIAYARMNGIVPPWSE